MMQTVQTKQFKALYPDYDSFKSSVITPIIAMHQTLPEYLDEQKMIYSFETIYKFFWNKYSEFYAVNVDSKQNELMQNALQNVLPALYVKSKQISNEALSNLDIKNLLTNITKVYNNDPDNKFASTETMFGENPDNNESTSANKTFNIDTIKDKNVVNRKDATERIKEVNDYIRKFSAISNIEISGLVHLLINDFSFSSLWKIELQQTISVIQHDVSEFKNKQKTIEQDSAVTTIQFSTLVMLISGSELKIGQYAGEDNQGDFGISIGYGAGRHSQGHNGIGIGQSAGRDQFEEAVAIGRESGFLHQGNNSVALGARAGYSHQGRNSIAINANDVALNVSENGIKMQAGINLLEVTPEGALELNGTGVGNNSTFGDKSLTDTQPKAVTSENFGKIDMLSGHEVKVGGAAGENGQGSFSVAVGLGAGKNNQGTDSVAIGRIAGENNQGEHSVAIGQWAGSENQGKNSIAINAKHEALSVLENGIKRNWITT